MKLIVRRDQAEQKGLLGGHKGMSFHLQAWVELTAQESELLARYRGVEHTPLTAVEIPDGRLPATIVTVASLTAGQSFATGDVQVLMAAEQEIKQGCDNFRTLLEVMASFGGQIEYDLGSPLTD